MPFQGVASVVAYFGRNLFDRVCACISTQVHNRISRGFGLLGPLFLLASGLFTVDISAQIGPPSGEPETSNSVLASLATATTGAFSGQSTAPSPGITLSVPGQSAPVEVDLGWQEPPTSPVPITGYLVLRADVSAGPFTSLTSTPETATSYVDSSVQDGMTYYYQLESVGSDGATSVPSSTYEILAANPIAFGTEKIGSSSAVQKVTVTNTGTAALTFTSIGLTGANTNQFVESNNCGTTLAASDSCTISAQFSPTTTGVEIAAITLSDDVTGSPQSIPLNGTGVKLTTLALTSSSNPAALGAVLAFTATLNATSPAPTGKITFLDGATELGAVPLTNSAATYSTSSLAAGTHSIKASYPGDDNYEPVTSSILTESILSQATQINFSHGFALAQATMKLNGSATLNGSRLQLTDGSPDQAGSAFYSTSLDVQNFGTDFTFQLLNPAADGFTFTLQNVGPGALGTAGGNLGYATIPHSVAVKFDLHNNAGEGNNSTGIYENGGEPTVPAIDLTGTGIDLHSGDSMHVHMTYDGTTLSMILTDLATGATGVESWPLNLISALGGKIAWVGFTGGTGGSTSTQEITSWTFIGGS